MSEGNTEKKLIELEKTLSNVEFSYQSLSELFKFFENPISTKSIRSIHEIPLAEKKTLENFRRQYSELSDSLKAQLPHQSLDELLTSQHPASTKPREILFNKETLEKFLYQYRELRDSLKQLPNQIETLKGALNRDSNTDHHSHAHDLFEEYNLFMKNKAPHLDKIASTFVIEWEKKQKLSLPKSPKPTTVLDSTNNTTFSFRTIWQKLKEYFSRKPKPTTSVLDSKPNSKNTANSYTTISLPPKSKPQSIPVAAPELKAENKRPASPNHTMSLWQQLKNSFSSKSTKPNSAPELKPKDKIEIPRFSSFRGKPKLVPSHIIPSKKDAKEDAPQKTFQT